MVVLPPRQTALLLQSQTSFHHKPHRQPGHLCPCPRRTLLSSSADLPDFHFSGLLDIGVREHSTWQQSRLSDKTLKAEVRKACDVALDDGLDLAQIDEDESPDCFAKRGIKRGIARRFVNDIRFWAENVIVI